MGITVVWRKKYPDGGLCRKCSPKSILSSASLCMMNRMGYVWPDGSKLFSFKSKTFALSYSFTLKSWKIFLDGSSYLFIRELNREHFPVAAFHKRINFYNS